MFWEIIEDTLENPVKIPNYLNRDTPFDDGFMKQIAPYNLKKHVSEYQNVDSVSLKRYFKNYHHIKRDWEDTLFQDKKDIFLKTADLIENKYYHQIC